MNNTINFPLEVSKGIMIVFLQFGTEPFKEILKEAGHDIPSSVIQESFSKLYNTLSSEKPTTKLSPLESRLVVVDTKKVPKVTKKVPKKACKEGTTRPRCIGTYIRGPKTGLQCEKIASKDNEYCVSCKNTKNAKKKAQGNPNESKLGEASNFLTKNNPTKKSSNQGDEEDEQKVFNIKAVDWDPERNLMLDEVYGFILTTSASDDIVAVGILNKETGQPEPLSESDKEKAKSLNLLIADDIVKPKKPVEIETMYDEGNIPDIPEL
jgi:hypothetical protein